MKKEKGIALITLIIIIIGILVIGGVTFFIVSKNMNYTKKDRVISGNKKENADDSSYNSEENKNDPNNPIGKYVIYLNDFKIVLGKTKIDDIIDNVGLTVTYDDTSESMNYNGSEKYRIREVKLSDGINTIVIESMRGKPDIVKNLSTLANGKTTDADFDFSTKTKITCVDNKFGKNISIGDYFTQDEYYNCYKITGTAYKDRDTIYSSQTKYLANDIFAYYLDDDYKIINLYATLSYDSTY